MNDQLITDAIRTTQAAWKMGYEARKAEEQTEPDSPERRCGGPGCDMKCCQPVAQRGAMFHTHPAVERQRSVEAAVRPACGVDPAAKAEPVQEPVGAVLVNRESREGVMFYSVDMIPDPSTLKDCFELVPVYTSPPQRLPLTDEEIFAIENDIPDDVIGDRAWTIWLSRAVERAHKIGGQP